MVFLIAFYWDSVLGVFFKGNLNMEYVLKNNFKIRTLALKDHSINTGQIQQICPKILQSNWV